MPIALVKLSKQRKDGKPRVRACWHNPYDRGAKPQYKVHWDLAWLEEWGRQMDSAARDAKLNPEALPPPPAPVWETTTFAELVEVWRETWQPTLSPRSQSRYHSILTNYLLPAWGTRKLDKITREVAMRYFADLATTCSPGQWRKVQVVASSVFRLGVELDYAAKNPVSRLKAPELPEHEMLALTAAEVRTLAETINPRYRVLIYTAGWCGLRASELYALQRRDIDLKLGRIIIRRALKRGYGEGVAADAPLFGKPKNGRERYVSMPAFLRDLLEEQLTTISPTPAALVFTAPQGGVIRHELFRRRHYCPAVKKALPDKPGLRFHDLRHSAASLAIAYGANAQQVSQRLGHKDVRTTARYSHLFEGHDDALLARFDQAHNAGTPDRHLRAVEGEAA